MRFLSTEGHLRKFLAHHDEISLPPPFLSIPPAQSRDAVTLYFLGRRKQGSKFHWYCMVDNTHTQIIRTKSIQMNLQSTKFLFDSGQGLLSCTHQELLILELPSVDRFPAHTGSVREVPALEHELQSQFQYSAKRETSQGADLCTGVAPTVLLKHQTHTIRCSRRIQDAMMKTRYSCRIPRLRVGGPSGFGRCIRTMLRPLPIFQKQPTF